MTTPGGVANLPVGALTLDTLKSKLQDMSGAAMKARAVERFPGTFNGSTGGSPALDLTPFGILTRIWAEVNSLIANADPADINGPEDIPELLLEFIEGLPVVGQFVDILKAIIGEYDGQDDVLLAVQDIFAPIRELVRLVAGGLEEFPDADDITEGWEQLEGTVSAAFERVLTLGGLFNINDWDNPPTLNQFLHWLADQLNPLNLIEAALPPNIMSNLQAALGDVNLDVEVDDFDPAAAIPPQLQELVDAGVKALGNATENVAGSVPQLFDLWAQQQRQITDMNAGLAALKADQQGQINSGKSVTVSLAGVANTSDLTPLGFTKIVDAGTQNIVVLDEAFDMGNAAASSEGYLYTLDKLATDYFETSFVMPRQAGHTTTIFGTNSGNSGTTVIGRSNLSGARRCQARVWYDKIRIGCVVDGNTTWFAPAGGGSVDAAAIAPPGAYVTFRGGTTGGVRIFQVLVNNQVKITRVDTGNVSYLGEDYRYCGILMETDGTYRPNNISVWTMNDNAPAATAGTFFRAYRSGGSTAQNQDGWAVFAPNTLNVEDRRSADLGWDPETQTLTITKEGPYSFPMRIRTAVNPADSEEYGVGVYHTSGGVTTLYRGGGFDHPSVSGGNNTSANLTNQNRVYGGSPVTLYCLPGDTIQPAWCGNNRSTTFGGIPQGITGDGAGSETWFCAIKHG
ncbi:DUF7257 domain-containing protein [Mycolicibacterium litorale]|uniref:DUF7257 domain-containing protein n=1 Tax=Mycolicibacterium litorale TaxID=758802 RepID=UPI003CF46710